MTERRSETIIPFSWIGWEPVDELVHCYYGVLFESDFGDFSKGEEIEVLNVDYGKGTVEVIDHEGNVVRSQQWKANPIS